MCRLAPPSLSTFKTMGDSKGWLLDFRPNAWKLWSATEQKKVLHTSWSDSITAPETAEKLSLKLPPPSTQEAIGSLCFLQQRISHLTSCWSAACGFSIQHILLVEAPHCVHPLPPTIRDTCLCPSDSAHMQWHTANKPWLRDLWWPPKLLNPLTDCH